MESQPKTGEGGLRGVKTKGPLQRIGLKQQQKFRNTLDRWLVKPSKSTITAEVCQTQEDADMSDDGDFQSTSAKSLDDKNVEKSYVSDTDEETQPMTPQLLDQDQDQGQDHESPVSKDCAKSSVMQTQSRNDDEFEKQEMGASSEGSSRHGNKITDFFPGVSSQGLPERRSKAKRSPEKPGADKEPTSADVKWLGTPINELKRMPECGGRLPPLKDVPGQHTVMIRV